MYARSFYEHTGNIITFAQFKEENLVQNERIVASYQSNFALMYESCTEDDSDGGSICTKYHEEICNENCVHPDIIARDAILKICDHMKQATIEWKEE